ncbi:MAG: hypothetical protein Q9217_005413 [Psora testacea]
MDMEGMGMSGGGMGSMSMGDGLPNLFYMQKMYWAVVGAAIGVATLANILNNILLRQRLSSRDSDTPARPKTVLFRTVATMKATTRELTNATLPLAISRKLHCSHPTLGRTCLVMAELTLVLILCFYKLDPRNQWRWEDIGYRTGFISAAQLPLVILLAGKRNIIGFLIGSSYERLNWLHRWVSRILFLTITIHMGFWFTNWARYDYIKVKLTTDVITQRGFAAWCILLWIVLSSFAPVRRWNYEFFVVQHIVTFIGFLAAVFLHLPVEVKAYIWIPIAVYIFDRTLRTIFVLWMNLSVFHPRSKRASFWTCAATLETLSYDTSRIVIKNPPISWRPGQHVFLSCHGIAPFQSHPFTIASIPEDNRMDFLVKSKSGATKRFYAHAAKCQSLPTSNKDLRPEQTFCAVIDGPYGQMRPLRQFDSVFLIAGGSGGTFAVPLMRDIVASSKHTSDTNTRGQHFWQMPKGAITRYVRFIWVVKSGDQYNWFADQLSQVAAGIEELQYNGHDIEVEMSIYNTCDTTLEAEPKTAFLLNPPTLLHNQHEEIPLSEFRTLNLEKPEAEPISIGSVMSQPMGEQITTKQTCRSNRTCCCATIIEDEDAITKADGQQCCCCDNSPQGSRQPSTANSDETKSSTSPLEVVKAQATTLHPSIPVLAGRPHPKTLIRKTLEQALGESAVVVCGPQGLINDVRSSVVALSDERAVHKGTGAQGTPRRKVKKVHKTSGTDDKKLQTSLKKLNVQPIQAIEEVNMFKEDGNVIHFAAPKVHASVPSNTFAIYGNGEDKELTELVPGILNQLGPDSLASLKKLAESYQSLQKKDGGGDGGKGDDDDDDDIPDLVEGENFESKVE